MNRLKGKVAVIAGAGPGIGRATAVLFADEGARVAVISRKKEVGDETVQMISDRGGQAMAVAADLTQTAQVEKALDEIVKKFGKIDVLHCNAGSYSVSTVKEMLESSWDDMFDVNLKSYFLAVRAAIPAFAANGGGSIILTGAIYGFTSNPKNMAHYNASKAGVAALTKSLALELSPQNIRVNCICPGQVSHNLFTQGASALQTDPKLLRNGVPEDAAFAALYFASDEAAWITGATLVIDGGASVGVYPSKTKP